MKIEPVRIVGVVLMLVTITLVASASVIWSLISANQSLWEIYVALTHISDHVYGSARAEALNSVRSFVESPAFARAVEMSPDSGLKNITSESLSDGTNVTALADWMATYINTQITTATYLVVLLTIVAGTLVVVLLVTRSDLEHRHGIAQNARRLSHAVVDTQDYERERLGREIHDNIGQLLSLVRLELSSGRVAEARRTLDNALTELRGLSRQLSLPAQSAADLTTELTELGRRLQDSARIPVSVSVTGLDQAHPTIRRQAFRITQELLSNGIEHAEATHLAVRILGVHPVLVLVYTDDGIGFDIQQVRTGVGLRSIQQRVELHGGTIRQRALSARGTGTSVRIELPLKSREERIE